MIHPDLQPSAEYVHDMEQLSGTTRRLADGLGQFLEQLLDVGFTQEGAEHLCDTMLIAMFHE